MNFQVVALNNEILHFRGDKDGVRWAHRKAIVTNLYSVYQI